MEHTIFKIYRHKTHKDIYLACNWQYCGGDEFTPFYYATKDPMKALIDANRPGFTSWMDHFHGDNGKTRLLAMITEQKEVDLDGFNGVLQKVFTFNVSDFECIHLAEVPND